MALKKTSRKKFYRKEKAWLLFEVSSARAGHRKSVLALFSDGTKAEYILFENYPGESVSYYKDVMEFLAPDDEY